MTVTVKCNHCGETMNADRPARYPVKYKCQSCGELFECSMETIHLRTNKEIHVMGDSEILFTIRQTNAGMQISFEHEHPMQVTTRIEEGEHGHYLVLEANYEQQLYLLKP